MKPSHENERARCRHEVNRFFWLIGDNLSRCDAILLDRRRGHAYTDCRVTKYMDGPVRSNDDEICLNADSNEGPNDDIHNAKSSELVRNLIRGM